MATMSTQPISLPHNTSNNSVVDYPMASGSYTGSNNGSFNPASYTRHFLGSPISWRAGSFGGRVYGSGSPMDQFIGSLETNEFKIKPSSSVESDRGNIRNALQIFDREGELCRNYTCCGLHLTDLHALLEHFEEVHIVVVDQPSAPDGKEAQLHIPFNPQAVPPITEHHHSGGQHTPSGVGFPSHPSQQQQQQQQHYRISNTHPISQQNQYPNGFDVDDMELEADVPQQDLSQGQSASSRSSPESSGALTPPDTPVTTPSSAYPSPTVLSKGVLPGQNPQYAHMQPASPYSNQSPYTSQPPSPHNPMAGSPVAAFDTTTVVRRPSVNTPVANNNANSQTSARPNLNLNLATTFSRPSSTTPHGQSLVEPFNPYARYAADYSVGMPGANLDGDSVGIDAGGVMPSAMDSSTAYASPVIGNPPTSAGGMEGCVPPALLFSNSNTPEDTPNTSRVPSPTAPTQQQAKATEGSAPATPTTPGGSQQQQRLTSSLSRPAQSFMLPSAKPFKCPKPNCNKSYKQANGLKYHITHGSCNFAPPKDLEHVQALIERKRRERAAAGASESEADDGSGLLTPTGSAGTPVSTAFPDLGSITETELREVEREAEKRLRPFACGVGDCTRRYKNMNGLRYHYQHSGEHGAVGLALLASGVHECLNNGGNGSGSRENSSVRGAEREGRKPRPHKGTSSKPSSRATSLSRTNTPVSPAAVLAQAHQHTQQQFPQHQQQHQQQSQPVTTASQPSFAAASQQIQAQAQLAYQQRFNEHQRAQYAQQAQQLQQQLQQQHMNIDQQQMTEPRMHNLQARFAAMYGGDASMSG